MSPERAPLRAHVPARWSPRVLRVVDVRAGQPRHPPALLSPVLWQPSLPETYLKLTPDELAAKISARRKELGPKLVILGHHYQTDEIIRHADHTGDSLKLS